MGVVVVELYEALQKAGVDEPLARSAAAAVVPSNGLDYLATKTDIRDMATKSDIKDMATKSDLKDLRIEIAELKSDLIKWNIGTMVALTALCVAIMRLG